LQFVGPETSEWMGLPAWHSGLRFSSLPCLHAERYLGTLSCAFLFTLIAGHIYLFFSIVTHNSLKVEYCSRLKTLNFRFSTSPHGPRSLTFVRGRANLSPSTSTRCFSGIKQPFLDSFCSELRSPLLGSMSQGRSSGRQWKQETRCWSHVSFVYTAAHATTSKWSGLRIETNSLRL
jgi:hypothetical protein